MPSMPDNIKPGEIIRAEWLNRAKNVAITDLRVAPPLNMHRLGGQVTISLLNRQSIPASASVTTFLAKITGSTSLGTNSWKYAWSEVFFDSDTVLNVSNGRSGTTTAEYAVNMAEMFHTSTYAWGVDTTGGDYPAGFVVQPVGGGGATVAHRYDVAVTMTQVVDLDGITRYLFHAMGSHDGDC